MTGDDRPTADAGGDGTAEPIADGGTTEPDADGEPTGSDGDGPRRPDFDVEDLETPEMGEVTLRDEDLHRPDELDGETVACTLTETEAEKREAWIQAELVPHLEAVERRGDDGAGDDVGVGYTLVFAEEALEAVMRFSRHEHWCCSFAHFEVHVTPGEEPNELSVYGPAGTDEMFEAEFVERMAEAAGVPGLA